jgi:predicted dehydrogenase
MGLRFGIIGLRHFHAYEMINGMMATPGVEVCAVAEPDDEVYRRAGSELGLPRYRDWRRMIADAAIDAVGIVNVPDERAEVVNQCLDIGVHVLCDKPAAIGWESLWRLDEAASESSAVLFPFFTVRYDPPVVALKRLVDAGALGDIVSFTSFRPHKLLAETRAPWFFERSRYGGVIVDLGIHDVDVYSWIAHPCEIEVFAAHSNATCRQHDEFEDTGHFMIRPSGEGAVGMFRTDWLTPAKEIMHGDCRYFVVGTRGAAEVRTTGGLPQEGGSISYVSDVAEPTQIELEFPRTTLYEDFVDAASGGEPAIAAADLLWANAMVLAARDSADRGKIVALRRHEKPFHENDMEKRIIFANRE